MIDYSHPVLLSLRRAGQKLGVLRPAVRIYRKIFKLSYEDDFDHQMMKQVTMNDVVWDIGANVGYFTQKFVEKVGPNGYVFAFEPAVSSYSSLVRNCAEYPNVICLNMALSNKAGTVNFRDSGLDNDPTNGLVDEDCPGAVKVTAASADELISNKSVPAPNVLKIDVEGYEFDVISGMTACLRLASTKKIFVEVHFLEMNRRGLKAGSADIVRSIREAGFSVEWTDPSHFIAIRQ
jgi:FkbM family methyltransferase